MSVIWIMVALLAVGVVYWALSNMGRWLDEINEDE